MPTPSEIPQALKVSHPEMNNSPINIYEYMYGDHHSYIIYYSAIVLILVAGPSLCLTIVLYERFGGDRQKRTIINRLCSLIFTNIAIQSCIWSILRIMRDMFGLLPAHIINVVGLFSMIVENSTLFFVTELTLFRFLYIVVWRRMKTIEDDFWNVVLTASTYLIAIWMALAFHLCVGPRYDLNQIVDVTQYEDKRYVIIFHLYFYEIICTVTNKIILLL